MEYEDERNDVEPDPSIPAVSIVELDKKTREDLVDFATGDYEVEDAAGLPKPELVFRIL